MTSLDQALQECVELERDAYLRMENADDAKKSDQEKEKKLAENARSTARLTNARTCLYGGQTSDFFRVDPPSLEEYFFTR